MMIYKYQMHIDRLLAEGYVMPKVHGPNGMEAFRYVFSKASPNNHKPVCVQNPSRRLPDNEKFSGYALSCFDNKKSAEKRYKALCTSFKRTPKAIGDALCSGNLRNEDGMVTSPDANSGHFDLFESTTCDLSKAFKIIEQLWKQ